MAAPVQRHAHAVALGVGLLVAGCWVLYRTYDGSGRRKPWFLGPFVPF